MDDALFRELTGALEDALPEVTDMDQLAPKLIDRLPAAP